jgi:membrane protease YdiL (CAAX protease family)
MNALIGIAGVIALLLITGTALGLLDRRHFSLRWLLIAAGLVLLNDALLTNGYHLIPKLLPTSDWNWQGKTLALAATLLIAALPAFGWRRCGLTLRQDWTGWRTTCAVALIVCAIFLGLALYLPDEPYSRETLAFQLTMPGLEEEPYYRGILLLALNEAFRGRVRMLGISLGWGALLSCALFGLGHAFGYADGAFSFDPLTMALTALPAFILVWLRERTGSLLLPVVLHNFANSISLLL